MIDGIFRFNPAVELVVFDRLDAAVQGRFAALARDPTFYGVLITPTTAKAVDRDSALLLLTLRSPGAIPRYALRALGDRASRTIAGWLLDGILETERGGEWVSGPAAVSLAGGHDLAGHDVIGRLSIEALRYAAALPIREPSVLARRLYGYNHLPLTPRYLRTYAGETDAVRLGLDVGRAAATLERQWTRLRVSVPWLAWAARDGDRATSALDGKSHKLYVSPMPGAMRQVFSAAVAAAVPHRPYAVKVGRGPHGLLRPDKMVMYFTRRDDLHGAAAAVAAAVAGAPAHGTPFTSSVTPDGLLSWGVDPSHGEEMVSALGSESWRERLTNQMAAAILAAPQDDVAPEDDVVRHVLARLVAHGVDVETWSPVT